MSKIEIKNLTLGELSKLLEMTGESSFRARQIFKWVYQKGVPCFDDMRNLSKELRRNLALRFSIGEIGAKEFVSRDGTVKTLFTLDDGNSVESVLIPMNGTYTLCLSSQVGCGLGCRFCLTGKAGFKRNLNAWEIVEQAARAYRIYGRDKKIGNLVFMGMGEPLLNYDNLKKAIEIIKSQDGLSVSGKRITVSTAGITPLIGKVIEECEVKLAVSLNSAFDDKRTALMPLNRKYPLSELLDELKKLPLKHRDRITIEYVVLKGVNDSAKDAQALQKVLTSIRCKINLIPYNDAKGLDFRGTSYSQIEKFRSLVESQGIPVTVRKSRGIDIGAACGQLVAGYMLGHKNDRNN